VCASTKTVDLLSINYFIDFAEMLFDKLMCFVAA